MNRRFAAQTPTPSRFNAVKLILLLALLSSSLLHAAAPNVVIILADDLGYGDLSCYGHPAFKTPRIDQMAAEGMRLTQFNCPMPFCAPTRASLLTGRYPFRCGMTLNPAPDGGPATDAIALSSSEVTLAQVLKTVGYATGMVGKWHLGHHDGSLPTDRGFDEYYGIPYSNDMRPVQLLEGTKVAENPVVQATLTKRYTDRAVDFIHRNKSHPFFFYFAHAMPHKPLAPSEESYKKSGAGIYGDVMSDLDTSIGRVLDALSEAGIDGNTLVLFTSDNGPWFGGSSGGLRGMKGSTWEGGYRVPMIARWPGRIPPGRSGAQLSVMMDLFATTLAVTGAKMPDDRTIDGRDLMPVLADNAPSPHDVIFGAHGAKLHHIRDARWKLHVLPAKEMRLKAGATGLWDDPRAPDGVTILAPFEQHNIQDLPWVAGGDSPAAMQLFDLQNDPAEHHDVAASHPGEVQRLKALFDAQNKDVPEVAPVKPRPNK